MKNIPVFILLFLCLTQAFYSQDMTGDVKVKNGWDYYSEGNYRKSLEALQTEKRYFPDRVNIYVISGWNYRELKEFGNMEATSLEGLKYQPTDSRLHRNLGEAYYYQNKYSDAVRTFETYLKYKYQPKNDAYLPTVYYYLGVCYLNLKQYRKADICFSYSKYYTPNNSQTILFLAECKENLAEYDKAYKFYEESLRLKPNNTKGLEGLNRLKNKITKAN